MASHNLSHAVHYMTQRFIFRMSSHEYVINIFRFLHYLSSAINFEFVGFIQLFASANMDVIALIIALIDRAHCYVHFWHIYCYNYM